VTEESKNLSDLHLDGPGHLFPPDKFHRLVDTITIACVMQGIEPDTPVEVHTSIEVIAWLHALLCQCQDE
jgi:hypothetical protein